MTALGGIDHDVVLFLGDLNYRIAAGVPDAVKAQYQRHPFPWGPPVPSRA